MKVTENGNRPEALAYDLIQQAWKEWGKAANCSVNGKFTWFDIQRLALRSTASYGDCLIIFALVESLDKSRCSRAAPLRG